MLSYIKAKYVNTVYTCVYMYLHTFRQYFINEATFIPSQKKKQRSCELGASPLQWHPSGTRASFLASGQEMCPLTFMFPQYFMTKVVWIYYLWNRGGWPFDFSLWFLMVVEIWVCLSIWLVFYTFLSKYSQDLKETW